LVSDNNTALHFEIGLCENAILLDRTSGPFSNLGKTNQRHKNGLRAD
jgi:hypothetical protein